MSKTVWILNHYAYAPDQSAGTRHYELARQIKKEGGDVVVVSCSFFHKTHSWRPGAKWKLFNKERVEGVDYVWVWGSPYRSNGLGRTLNLLTYALLATLYVLVKGKKRDVLFASSPQPFASLFSFLALRNRMIRVFEVRDFWPQIFVDMGIMDPGSRTARMLFRIERFLISSSDLFVSNLSGAERYCRERRINFRNFYWVPNGVRSESKNDQTERVKLAGKDSSTKILYTGAHGEAQNLYEVIRAAKDLDFSNKVEFHFLGDGTEKRNLKDFARDNNLENVFFYEPVNTKEVKNYIASADALLLPLINAKIFNYGISPNKLPEYLASGKPIIYFGPIGACPFSDGIDAVVAGGTASEDLVGAIKIFLSMSESDKSEMRKNSDRLMSSKFLLDQSMGNLVRDILSEKYG